MRELLGSCLSVPPRARPSAAAILQLPIVKRRVERLLAQGATGPQVLMLGT